MGAVGGQIEPYYLSKVMGTSTCDMLVAPEVDMKGKLVKEFVARWMGPLFRDDRIRSWSIRIWRCLCMVQKYSCMAFENLMSDTARIEETIDKIISELSKQALSCQWKKIRS
jgi:L-ribulokinase